jgi:hypothetical protein
MARMSSRNRAEFDGDPTVLLRNGSAGAITVTTAEAGISLQSLTKAFWDNNEQPQGVFTVAINCTAMTRLAGEVYFFIIEIAPTNAFVLAQTNAVAIVQISPIGVMPTVIGTGFYELTVPYSLIEFLDPTAKFIRIRAAIGGGGAPSLAYDARISYIDN